MARKIDTDANIDRVRMKQQFSHPSTPDSGYDWLYIISGSAHGGLYLQDPAGRRIGPFITGTAASTGANWTQVVDENGSSFSNWTAVGGVWSSDGSVIKQTGTSTVNFAKYNTPIITSLIIMEAEVQVRTAGIDKCAEIMVQFNGTGAGAVGLRINDNEKVEIVRTNTAVIASYATTIALNTWYKLRMIVSGNVVTAYLDGTLIMSGANVNGTNTATYIGLCSSNAETWYRNIKAWNLSVPA